MLNNGIFVQLSFNQFPDDVFEFTYLRPRKKPEIVIVTEVAVDGQNCQVWFDLHVRIYLYL